MVSIIIKSIHEIKALIMLYANLVLVVYAFDYVMGEILIKHDILVAYHLEILNNSLHNYSKYDYEIYVIIHVKQ
jgi:hypothetical protein